MTKYHYKIKLAQLNYNSGVRGRVGVKFPCATRHSNVIFVVIMIWMEKLVGGLNMTKYFDPQYDPGEFTDADAIATAENLSQWRPRKGDGGWPPTRELIAGSVARWEAVLRAVLSMSELGLDVTSARTLEVGAGYGDGLRPLLLAGFLPSNLTGVDLMEERLVTARERLPGMNFVHADAADMRDTFPDDAKFDLVIEQFCFCHIPHKDVKRRIAAEMLRVVRPGGFVLIHDWRLNALSRGIHGVSQSYIHDLFRVGETTDRVAVYPSHLWPPIGNRISRYASAFYQLFRLIPSLVGSKVTVLRKRP